MYILGIFGGSRKGSQDASATLLKNGRVIAAVEEERLIRTKHAVGRLPEKAIRSVLDFEKISMKDVNIIATDGLLYPKYLRPFEKSILRRIGYPAKKEFLERYIKSQFGCCPKIEIVNHHDAHCASAYYASGFKNAIIISADFSGDGIACQYGTGEGKNFNIIKRFLRPNSLGIYYSLLTQFVGFERDNDEYKVMGLSSYGNRSKYDFSWLVNLEDNGYKLNTEFIRISKYGRSNPGKQEPLYNSKLIEKLGPVRLPNEPMSEYYEDIAASGQRHLEDIFVNLVKDIYKLTGKKNLCLAGGVALNCVVNQQLMNLDFIDDIYVQPASSDAGISLGAAYLVAVNYGIDIEKLPHVYLGMEYTNNEIRNALELSQVKYYEVDDVASYAAEKVAENKIVGWFQGRMEFGPRALGSRSILANPTNTKMQDIVNEKIKFREQFRPFCPSVLEEDSQIYFDGKSKVAPYMTITYDVKDEFIEKIPSVTHVDNTARIQTVNKIQNPLYYNYLHELKKRIGLGISMNTSFNVKGDPIVNTPYQAISTFYGSGMDTLIIGNFILNK